jgi:hypothetical protein
MVTLAFYYHSIILKHFGGQLAINSKILVAKVKTIGSQR